MLYEKKSAIFIALKLHSPLKLEDDIDSLFALAVRGEFNLAGFEGEESVIGTDAHIQAGMDAGAALAHENASSRNDLAIIPLDAEHLRVAVAAVARGAHAFFMRHEKILQKKNGRRPAR